MCPRNLTPRLPNLSPTITEPAKSWKRSPRSTANSCAAERRSKKAAMGELSTLHPAIDAGLGGVLLANMVEAWLVGNPDCVTSEEATNELQDHGTTPEQAGLHLYPPVHAGSGAAPSGEYRAPICATRDGAGTGLERIGDPHTRSGPGNDGHRDDTAGGLQGSGCGCVDGASGRGVCAGSFAAGELESRLASAAGVVCTHGDAGDRRRWLLRSLGFQRRPLSRIEGDNGSSRAAFFARAPPGR